MTSDLTLYHYYECTYCGKVHKYLKANNIVVPMKNTRENPAYRAELIKIGGKGQVPCLVNDGLALYESDDIIEWFRENWKK